MGSFEGRLNDFADRFAERVLARLAEGISSAPSGGGSGPSSGGSPAAASSLSAPSVPGVGEIGAAALKGAGAGIRETPAGALGSPEVLAQNAAIGAAGGALEATIGKVPVAGDFVMAEFNAFENAVRQPAQRAERSEGRYVGNLAAAGYDLSASSIDQMTRRGLEVERRRFSAERRVERHVEEVNSQSSISWGLSQIGF